MDVRKNEQNREHIVVSVTGTGEIGPTWDFRVQDAKQNAERDASSGVVKKDEGRYNTVARGVVECLSHPACI